MLASVQPRFVPSISLGFFTAAPIEFIMNLQEFTRALFLTEMYTDSIVYVRNNCSLLRPRVDQ